jgi:hypothetical protein
MEHRTIEMGCQRKTREFNGALCKSVGNTSQIQLGGYDQNSVINKLYIFPMGTIKAKKRTTFVPNNF